MIVRRNWKQEKEYKLRPFCNRNSPALCFLIGARPLALSAASLCFCFTLNSLIIVSVVLPAAPLLCNIHNQFTRCQNLHTQQQQQQQQQTQTNHPSAAGSYTSFVNHLTTIKNLKLQRGTLSLRVQILHLFSASPHSSRATIAASRSAARRGSAEGKSPN